MSQIEATPRVPKGKIHFNLEYFNVLDAYLF